MSEPIRDPQLQERAKEKANGFESNRSRPNPKASELLQDFHSGQLQRNDLIVLHALTEWAQDHSPLEPSNREILEGLGHPITQSELSDSLLRLNDRGYIAFLPAPNNHAIGRRIMLNWF